MSIIVRTDEEIEDMQNLVAEKFDEGAAGAALALELLEWLTEADAPAPEF